MATRRAVTLIECIVVIALIALLVALLLPAIQKTRDAASRIDGNNRLKQISLGVHQFAASHGERLPTMDGVRPNIGLSVFCAIMPYTEIARDYRSITVVPFPAPLYLSPADPTVNDANRADGYCSFPANGQLFREGASIPHSMQDGSAQTIAFAEHYSSKCGWAAYPYARTHDEAPHRATFADNMNRYMPGLTDVHPVTSGDPPITTASVPGKTFQVAPTVSECDPWIAQTPHRAGMLIALADGSSRMISPAIKESVFWALVTPSGGESVSGW